MTEHEEIAEKGNTLMSKPVPQFKTNAEQRQAKADARISRRKKLVAAATGILLGLTGISAFASWSDSSEVGTTMTTGKYDLEMSVNGGAWTNGTDKVKLGWITSGANQVSSSSKLAPGDELKTTVALRLSSDSSHNGRLKSIQLNSGGTTNLDMAWTIKNSSGTVIMSGTNMANKSSSPNLLLKPGVTTTLTMDFTVGDNLPQSKTATPEWTFVTELDN